MKRIFIGLMSVAVIALASPASALTIDFEDLPGSTSYDVGETFTASSVTVEVFSSTGGYAFTSDAMLAAGSGKEIGIQNVILNFGFNPLDGLSFQFYEAGDITITINNYATTAVDFTDLNNTQLGGVSIFVVPTGNNTGALFLMGDIDIFAVGGQELYIDNMVASVIPEPATIAILGLGAIAIIKRKNK